MSRLGIWLAMRRIDWHQRMFVDGPLWWACGACREGRRIRRERNGQ